MPMLAAMAKETGKKLEFIEEMTTDVDAVQERVLEEILSRNAEAEYLAVKCGLAGATDRARAKVPISTYEDLQPYIRRVADGDRSHILTGPAHPISELLASSGTSGGEPKLIPTVKDDLDRRALLDDLVMPVMTKYVPGLDEGSDLYFHFVKSETTTPGGLPARTVLTSFFRSDHLKSLLYDPRYSYTSPAAAVLCEDTSQGMCAQMLCGLLHRRSVRRVGAAFAYGLVLAIRFLQLSWRELADDIEASALLTTRRVADPSVREAVASVLRRPDPELAHLIRAECSRDGGDCWAGIVPRIWPNAKCLDAIATGSMAQYVPALNHYGGGLPIVSTIYGSSECYIGLNLQPMVDPSEVSYTVMPNMAYLEFLPLPLPLEDTTEKASHHQQQQQLVELAGCRYRLGDVLRVAGFHNAAPRFRFVRRAGVLLSLDSIDKTDEAELQRAVDRAAALLRRRRGGAVQLADYTSRACAATVPGHYVIYWELTTTMGGGAAVENDGETLGRCCLEMEEALNAMYRQCRVKDGSIGPLEIRIVRPGTFEALMDYAVARGSSVGQYKVPRCVAAPGVVELLDSHVVSSHFSPRLPHWSPGEWFDGMTTAEERPSTSTDVVV
ncbi:unnamed protein product [Urochloa decumbens]|uniref:Uncharacterized protein n=1 Tax=Urochloa decumbens TaxID=240449 RepID=A0ABC8XE15_9POAL